MKFNITTRTDGLQNVRHRVEVMKRAPDETLKQLAEEQVAVVQNRIRNTKTDPDGQPWAPWSMATIRAYSRSGRGGSLLFRTGALLDSIQYRISEKTLTIFSNVGYAKYLQFGTPKMPARRFLGWNQESINRVKEILKEKINDR